MSVESSTVLNPIYRSVSSVIRRLISAVTAAPLVSGVAVTACGIAVYFARARVSGTKRVVPVIQSIGTSNPAYVSNKEYFLEVVSIPKMGAAKQQTPRKFVLLKREKRERC